MQCHVHHCDVMIVFYRVLAQEVRSYREEIAAEESRYHYLCAMIKTSQLHQERMTNELKAYRSSDPAEKKRTLR